MGENPVCCRNDPAALVRVGIDYHRQEIEIGQPLSERLFSAIHGRNR